MLRAFRSFRCFTQTTGTSFRAGIFMNFMVLLLLGSCWSIPSRAHAQSSTSPSQGPSTSLSITHGHVFLYASSGPVDVTSDLYTYANQTYVYCSDGSSMPIYIDYRMGDVYDYEGDIIGFVDQS